jgi:c-di-GMP phosphodiesterase Gmr
MPAPTRIDSAEELREALLQLHVDHEALGHSSAQAQQLLDALESLLAVEFDDDPFARMFVSLRRVFAFSHAFVLTESSATPGVLECIAADPPRLVGSQWPSGPLFARVMSGRVTATFSHAAVTEWRNALALDLSPEQAALYAPVRVREQRGILALLAAPGSEGFDRGHVALVRRFSVLASHALATRVASENAAEGRRLRELTAQLRDSELRSRRNAQLLEEIVNALPIGLAVQDEAGRLLLVNDAAAATVGQPAAHLRDGPAAALGTGVADDADRRQLLSGRARLVREVGMLIGSEPRTLMVTSKPLKIFDETLLVSATLDITERKRFEDEMSRRAFHDQLTGLPNRALMSEMVDNALRMHHRNGMFALAFIDLDSFKQVNDYYSHAVGDALLIAVARRIREHVRVGDTLARISGDEFLLLLNPLDSLEDLRPLVERVVDALKQPFFIEGHEVMTSASIGASIYPMHGDNYETLRRCADSAMYRAKHCRKGSAGYFDVTMDGAVTARMELEQQLRLAIRERRFKSAFQPKIDLQTRRVIGFEALVRWVEPDGRIRMPGTFIDLAGELGLLDEITHFVLDDVLRSLPVLSARYGADIRVSINIGARQAGDLAFMRTMIERLADSGLARRVVIELTEEALVATQRFERRVLPELRKLGVRVSIDDFGTGFSSLSTLADITADEVKVDRAFITAIHQRIRSQGILKAIESLCLALDVSVVAEGVETEEELEYLRTHTSIRLAQGYLFAHPQFLETLVPSSNEVDSQDLAEIA